MRLRFALPIALVFVLATAACGEWRAQMASEMAAQNFRSAVAFIELHKLQFGAYPDSLAELKFTGEFDQMWMTMVRYSKLGDGYRLDMPEGLPGSATLTYPADFWQGIGLRESNVKRPDGG